MFIGPRGDSDDFDSISAFIRGFPNFFVDECKGDYDYWGSLETFPYSSQEDSPMHRLRILLVVVAMLALCGTWAEGQDKTKDAKLRGQLPANWGKIGLTDEQKQKVYRVQTDYRGKIEVLEKQIDDLKSKQLKDMENVLTDAQKARLREITAGKGAGGK